MRNALKLITLMSGGLSYYQNIINLVGQSSIVAYYPMDEPSGTTVTDIVNALNGTVTNSTRGVAGIGDGKTATSFDGTGYGSWIAAKDTLNGSEGTLMIWAKVSAAADWTDGAFHVASRALVDAPNNIAIQKLNTNNTLQTPYKAGNTLLSPAMGNVSNTGWFNFGCVWSKSGNFVAGLYNGARFDLRTTLGDWAGVPTVMAIASNLAASASVAWKGSLAHMLLLNRALTEADSCKSVDLAGIGTRTFTMIGDSISSSATGYQIGVLGSYNGGNARLRNHAVSGGGIVAGSGAQLMDAQVVAAASDNADRIIIALGVNDNNGGNMTTLQAEAEENIIELKANHPNATIYWMNVLPNWTNNTTGPEVAKGNIRTAIAAACTAQSITCWDTYTDPWIAQNQTSDGLHPTAAGHAAILARILALV